MRKQSWLKRYFLNFLLIGLLPVALLMVLFGFTAQATLRTEIENGHYAAFSQFTGTLEALLGRMALVVDHLSDSAVDIPALREEDMDSQSAALLAQTLGAYENQMAWDVPVTLFARGAPRMYTSHGAVSWQDFQQSIAGCGNSDYSGLFTALSSTAWPTLHRLKREVSPQAVWGGAVAMLYPIPAMAAVPEATLCFLVDEKVLSAMLENCIAGLEGNLYLFSGIYQEAFALEGLPEEDSRDAARLLGTGIQFLGDSVVMRSVLQSGNLAVSFVCPRRIFYQRLGIVWRQVGLISLSTLLLAVAVAAVMSRRAYRPLSRLVRGITPAPEAALNNEFELIQTHMDAVAQRNTEVEQQLLRQQPMVMEACLAKLLMGKLQDRAEAEFHMRCAGMDLGGRSCFALLIGFQGGDAAYDTWTDQLRPQLRRPLPGGGQVYVLDSDVDGLLAALIVCPSGSGDPRAALAHSLLAGVQLQAPLRLLSGAGCLCRDPLQLHDSCMEAMAVVREFLPGSGETFACYDQAPGAQRLPFPTLDCALLSQSLKQADAAMARKALDKIMAEIRRTESLLYTQCLCYDVINNVLRTMQVLQPAFSSAQVHALCAFHSPEELERNLVPLLEEFCAGYGAVRESRSSKMREELIGYVAEHVFQYDFGLEQIADAFGLSQSYLSRFYKAETGYTFTQYVTNLRMERSKRLLAETALPLKEIVAQVGYIDTASFVRKFKSLEGVTPGQWREIYKA